MKNEMTNKWEMFDKTETVREQLNPDFHKSFKMDYYFETNQPLKFVVLDYDGDEKAKSDDFLGSTIVNLGTVIGTRG
jgi:Ca2+-dependent lipid-binding protein